MKERKIKAPKTLPEITASDEPYSLPHGWQWVRLGAIGNIFNGNSINASEKESKYAGVDGLPYIATKDVGYGFQPLYYDNGICIPPDEEKFRVARQGAVLICAEGGSAGKKCGLTDRDICFGNKLFANELYGHIPSRFILYVYLSPAFRASFAAAMTGIIGGVSIAKFVEIPIPLPPLDEQHRIVAKIDQLMARCDTLETLRKERDEIRLAVHTATIQQLLTIADSEQHQRAQAFLAENFGELYTVKENVAELRKAILQLAVMGKLVPQNPNDPPASILLKEIDAEKHRLVKAGKIKAPKPLAPIKSEEVPYPLPQGWEWVRFFAANTVRSELVSARDYPKEKQIAPDSMEKDTGRLLFHRTVAESGATGPNNRFYEGQILYSKIRPSLNKVTVAPYDGLCSADMYPIVCHSYISFMIITMLSELFLVQVRQAENRIKMPKLNLESLGQFLIPLPPLPEQHRIVDRIAQLMALCDTLDQKINDATDKQAELLDAVMARI